MQYDVAIIGAGPSGLSAAITLACEGRSVVLIDKAYNVGGQIAHSHLVENVVGYPAGFNGEVFAMQAHEQAINLGVTVLLGQQVMMLYRKDGEFVLHTQTPADIRATAVLITVGVAPRPLPFESEPGNCNVTNELHLQPAKPGEHVLVYGGGNSAGQAGCFYAKQGCIVTVLSRRPLVETMDGRWIATLQALGVTSMVGEIQQVTDTVIFCSSGETQSLTTPNHLHAFMGGDPVTGWLPGLQLDEKGYILTNDQHETSTPGIFAAGDCEAGTVKRFSCAIGGATEAASFVSRYLAGLDTNLSGLSESGGLDASLQIGV